MTTEEKLIEALKEIADCERRYDYDAKHSKSWNGDEAVGYLSEAAEIARAALEAVEPQRKEDEKKPAKTYKQALIIFWASDQTTSCVAEDTDKNPFADKEAEAIKNGNYYGLSAFEYKRLLEEAGYEWAWIEHNGDYGTYIREASKGYVFNGPYKGMKVGQSRTSDGNIHEGRFF